MQSPKGPCVRRLFYVSVTAFVGFGLSCSFSLMSFEASCLGVSWGREIESHRILFGSVLCLPISFITKPLPSLFCTLPH